MSNNPYRAGDSVGGTESFVGRDSLLQDIRVMIEDARPNVANALLLWGQRRMGKSSILQHLKSQLSDNYIVIDIDWLSKQQKSLPQVIEDLVTTLSLELNTPKPDLGTDAQTTFQSWWDKQLALQTRSVVLLMDEFDVIAKPETKEDIIIYVQELLTTLNPQRLKWVFVIGCKIDSLTSTAKQLFGKMGSRLVSYLKESEIQDLIHLSEQNQTLQWSDQTKKMVWQKTCGHPYFTQYLCSEVWNHCHQDQPTSPVTVTLQTVNAAFLKTLGNADGILESLWDSLSHTERVVASALAQGHKWTDLTGPLDHPLLKLEKARASLLEWDLIIAIDKGNYRFQVEIIRQWIEQRKSTSRYSELENIEPEAQAIYEIAKRLKETRPQNAQALLQQTLDLNPYHTQASLWLARLWATQRQFEKAQTELERLHYYNSQAAQALLIEVLLQWANSLEGNPEPLFPAHGFKRTIFRLQSLFSAKVDPNEAQQLKLYQRVLTLEPGNSKAIKGKQNLEKRRQARAWKQRVKNGLGNPITQGVLSALLALAISFGFYSKAYPPGIVLEIGQSSPDQYSLTGVPSSDESIQLLSIALRLNSKLIAPSKFAYREYTLDLPVESTDKRLVITDDFLLKGLPALTVKQFNYPTKKEIFEFKWSLTVPEKTLLVIEPDCEASTTDKRNITCKVRQQGFFSVFRSLPWLGWAVMGWVVLCVPLIILGQTSKNKEKEGYGVY